MRLSSLLLLASAAALLLAESQPGAPGQRIEVRTSDSRIEITGADTDRVQVNDSSHATVSTSNGSVVVEADAGGDGGSLKLQVPRRAALDVITSNGAIHVSGVGGSMRLSTSNGEISIKNAGAAPIRAYTSNGSIRVDVPAGLNANLSARTSNGRIHTDIEVMTNHTGTTFLEGKIGAGGAVIDLQTSNGSIYLQNDGQQENVTSTFKPGEVK